MSKHATPVTETIISRAEAIARLNDGLRKTGQGGVIVVTNGLRALACFDAQRLLELLASYDSFDADNDPHSEHDFGDLEFVGADLLWKIDYYDLDMDYASPDPADAAVTRRILTVMLASEW